MTTFAVPVAVFRVECEIASGRPFAATERTVLRSIAAGHAEFSGLLADLELHPRILSECVTVLFEAGIIEFKEGSGDLALTSLGQEALDDRGFIPATLDREQIERRIIVERITGLADLAGNIKYDRTDDLSERGIRVLRPSSIDPTPARSIVRQLIERSLKAGKWVRSVGPVQEVSRYSYSVRADVERGHVEGLPSPEWRRALTLELQARGVSLDEPDIVEPRAEWVAVPTSRITAIWGAEAHVAALEDILTRATSYVFIHSGFLTYDRAAALSEALSHALRRGVDVILAHGGSDEVTQSEEDAVKVFSKVQYDHRTAGGRFFFAPYSTGSHAKLVIRDSMEVCLGSFNWLSARADSRRPELSLRVSSAQLVADVCDVAADLLPRQGALWPAQTLRRPVNPDSAQSTEGGESVDIRLILDADNRGRLLRYLDDAKFMVAVWSDKVTAKSDPSLHEKLLRSARTLATRSTLLLRFSAIDGERASVLDGLAAAGARIVQDRVNHAKIALCDERYALITSFNLLSFGGQSRRRSSVFEMGLELRAPDDNALRGVLGSALTMMATNGADEV